MEDPVLTERFTIQQPALLGRLVRGGAWVFAGRTLGIGLTFLSHVVLARWLSPGEFGQFLMVVSIIGFLSILARFGLDRILVRFIAEGLGTGNAPLVGRTLRVAFSVGLASTVCVGILAILILGYLRDVLDLPVSVLVLLGSAIPLFTILCLVAESFRGFHQLRYASLFQAHSGPLTTLVFLGTLLIVATRPSLSTALVCYLISVACILPLAFWFLARTVKQSLRIDKDAARGDSTLPLSRAFSVCAPTAISDTLGFMAVNAGLWIAAVCCSQDDLALFGAARQLSTMIALPLNLINMTVVSSIAELHAQGHLAKLQRMLQIAATIAAIPAFLAVLSFLLAPALILQTVFGSFYRDAAQILIILSLARLFSTWTGGCLNTLLLTGRQNVVASINVLFVIVLLVLGPICGRAYGAVGVAVVSAGVIVMINLIAWTVARVQVGVWTHATLRLSG